MKSQILDLWPKMVERLASHSNVLESVAIIQAYRHYREEGMRVYSVGFNLAVRRILTRKNEDWEGDEDIPRKLPDLWGIRRDGKGSRTLVAMEIEDTHCLGIGELDSYVGIWQLFDSSSRWQSWGFEVWILNRYGERTSILNLLEISSTLGALSLHRQETKTAAAQLQVRNS